MKEKKQQKKRPLKRPRNKKNSKNVSCVAKETKRSPASSCGRRNEIKGRLEIESDGLYFPSKFFSR